jgi:NAD(P)-dependent dehydrogenase (short-subunit alcohol dehydrogenase family)
MINPEAKMLLGQHHLEKHVSAQKTIVITGASQGIGAQLTRSFFERGYNVVATARDAIRSKEIPASDRVARVDGDVADPATGHSVVDTALSRFGTIDALVNNAGIFFARPFVEYTLDDYRKLAATNIEGFLHITQPVVRQMLSQKTGGSVVTITTPLIDHPIAGIDVSVAMITKGGIEAASKNIAMELAKENIRLNMVAPGMVDTPLHKDDPMDFLATLSPMPGISRPQEVVDAVVYLTEAPRVTGEVLHVDGGAHLGRW